MNRLGRQGLILLIIACVCTMVSAQVSFQILPRANRTIDLGRDSKLLDLDADGYPELIQFQSGLYDEYLGSGRFTRWSGQIFMPLCPGAMGFGSGDVDGDGHIDHLVFYASTTSCPPQLMMGDGAHGFVDETSMRVPSIALAANLCHLVDVDGDGDLDAVLGIASRSSLCEVLLNDGSGYFSQAPGLTFGPDYVGWTGLRFMQSADFDTDGDLDLLLGIWGYDGGGVSRPYASQVYHNDGTGRFTLAQEFLPDYRLYSIDIGDVDGDGFLDLMMFGRWGPGIWSSGPDPTLMMNDGAGRFVRDDARLPQLRGEQEGALADFDQDGDLDIVAARPVPIALESGEYDVYAYWLNDGRGQFSDADPGFMPTTTRPDYTAGLMDAGDLDDDGDFDLIGAGVGRPPLGAGLYHPPGPHVLWNMKRHLYAPAEARLGQEYDVELTADAGHIVGLMLSFRAGWYDLGTLGRLRIDPSIAFAIPSYVMPATRKVTFTLPISMGPALLGLELHWQGLDIHPIRPELSRLTGVYHDVV